MSSSSDHEMSDCSSSSPLSYTINESPYSSPSQQVPQLTTHLTDLTCADKHIYNINNGNHPSLHIIEQPQDHFRFRYVSEMVGTHGCLLGKSTGNNKLKTHPTVELVNYTGQALIRCRLVQHNNGEEHPHKLLEEDEDRDVNYTVPEHNSYKVGFAGMGIIHTAKKDVSNLLFKKYAEQYKNTTFNAKELRARCDNVAKSINLNIVRLKFSAHDIETGKEICDPVFSDPIHNMKSAATNDLRITRISMCIGRPRGGEDVYILVEKVNKKNIMIRFYETADGTATGERVWSNNGKFLQSDVHHQYAIVFRTPPYRDPETAVDVKVFIELVRPSDGRTSEPKEFTYKAEQVFKQIRKRKASNYSNCSSLESSSSGTVMNEVPITVTFNNRNDVKDENTLSPYNIQLPLQPPSPSSQCGLGTALGGTLLTSEARSPMWGATEIPLAQSNIAMAFTLSNPEERVDSLSKLYQMSFDDITEDGQKITEADFSKYVGSFSSSLSDIQTEITGMEFIRASTTLVADSGRVKVEPSSPTSSFSPASPPTQSSGAERPDTDRTKVNPEYPAFYKPEDGSEVKKLVKELCEIIKNKKGYKKQEVRNKLERLFDIRLSNGDTFLHMTLCSNQPSFEAIVKVIFSVKMTHLLNYANNKQQTILHLAVINGLSKVVSLLIAKGCNPMLGDSDEDNAIHYAVRYNNECLETLLDAIKKNDVTCDLNAYNNDKLTALHLSVLHDSAESARLLLKHGASCLVRDAQGRTPLHLAAYDQRLQLQRELLHTQRPSDVVDAVDGRGNTALQIVCGMGVDDNSLEIVKLLLDNKADPLKHEDNNESAWKLSRDKPAVREIMKGYVSHAVALEDDVKSEPEDEYESADDDMEGTGLSELSAYGPAVAARVEAAGAWRELAQRLRAGSLVSWFQNQPSPAYTLLTHVKECGEDITSKSLALILEDMGLVDAANIIRSHIE